MSKLEQAREEARIIRPWRFFEVVQPGRPPQIITAADGTRAIMRAWLMLGPATKITSLHDFRAAVTCKPCQQPTRDGYEELRRRHRIDLRPGQRVRVKPPGLAVRGLGYVVYPQGVANKVHVILDGTAEPICIEPVCIQAI